MKIRRGSEATLPIKNQTGKPLRIFIEILCDEYEVPVGGEAVVSLPDGFELIEVYEDQVTIWNKGAEHSVEIVPPQAD